MNTSYQFENLSMTERVARFSISTIVTVAAMESTLPGTTLFAVINILAIALATSAIIGWDPAKAVSLRSKLRIAQHKDSHHGHHV